LPFFLAFVFFALVSDALVTDAAALTLAAAEPDEVLGLSVPDALPFAKLEFDEVALELEVSEVVAGARLAAAVAG